MSFRSIVFLCCFYFAPLWAADISVTGRCQREVEPDRVSVVLGSRVTDRDAGTASKAVSQTYEAIRKEVKKLNLKDVKLQTSNYSVSPEWDYSTPKRVFKGYTASMGLEIETSEIARVSELFSVSTKLKLQDVSGLTTFLSPALAKQVHDSCLEVAVKEAKVKADKMSAAAGLKISELISLNETQPVSSPVHGMAKMEFADARGGGEAGFEVKPIAIDVTIYAKYALK